MHNAYYKLLNKHHFQVDISTIAGASILSTEYATVSHQGEILLKLI
jgi:hypothetical protein